MLIQIDIITPGQNVGIESALPHSRLPGEAQIPHHLQRPPLFVDSRLAILLHSHHHIHHLHTKYHQTYLVTALFIAWTCSYAFEMMVPIASLLVVRYGKYYRGAYGYIVVMVLYKIGVVISVLTVSWRHVGLCYIPYSMRVIIIVTNSLEVVCLVV